MSGYVVRGIDPAPWLGLYGASDEVLAEAGAVRMTVAEKPGAPCRVTLEDAEPGETVLLVNFEHQPAATPYRSQHAIFVREGVRRAAEFRDALPESIRCRLVSVRAFDAADMMIDAEVLEGCALEPWLLAQLARAETAYLHIHNARRGCFAARVDRAE